MPFILRVSFGLKWMSISGSIGQNIKQPLPIVIPGAISSRFRTILFVEPAHVWFFLFFCAALNLNRGNGRI